MNSKIKAIAAVFAASGMILFTSCEKEAETPKPVVNLTELGYENSKTGYAGSDLHIEADIVAKGRIDKVSIEIHPEGDHEKSTLKILYEGEWEVDTTYTKFSGLKNTLFHEHLNIPVGAGPGHYHFHLTVTDREGNQTIVEEELEIKQPEDDVFPIINITTAPSDNQSFSNGQSISISGSVSDDKALGGMYIGLVREGQNLTDAEVNATNTITILHAHDFNSPTSHHFLAGIVVGAAMDNNITPKATIWTPGNYYILVKCKDAFGGNWTYSSHYPIVIN